jgi:predicted ATPase
LFDAVAQLTISLAQRAPLVLFIDDLHWADSATLELLPYLLRRWRAVNAHALLLGSLRSEAMHPSGLSSLMAWLTQMERELAPQHLTLEPLGEAETLQIVQACFVPPASDFAQWLFSETHGHPFYLMETLKDLLERGVLQAKRRAERHWTFAMDAEHDLGQAARVPSTIRAVIRSRLNRLSPPAFALLAAAAVLEHQLAFDRLGAIAHVPADTALPAFDELVSSRLLLEAASGYVFPNDMLRDVVYTEAGDARRRLFHRRALAHLIAASAPAAVLTHHAEMAGMVAAAFRHSLAAGEEALRLSAFSEAIVHFEKARQFAREAGWTSPELEAHLGEVYRQLGHAYTLNGQPEQAALVEAEHSRSK